MLAISRENMHCDSRSKTQSIQILGEKQSYVKSSPNSSAAKAMKTCILHKAAEKFRIEFSELLLPGKDFALQQKLGTFYFHNI